MTVINNIIIGKNRPKYQPQRRKEKENHWPHQYDGQNMVRPTMEKIQKIHLSSHLNNVI
jgi:hypothetical protein